MGFPAARDGPDARDDATDDARARPVLIGWPTFSDLKPTRPDPTRPGRRDPARPQTGAGTIAISSSTVWEVRTTGNDANGGGFVAGSSGTDYSQQDAAQLSVSDADASGTTNLHSATGGFTSAMVGNLVQLSGGTLTAGFYQIVAFVDANNVTLHQSPGTGSGSAARVGGALKTLGKLSGAMAASNKAWIKAGTYNESIVTFAQAVATPGPTTPPTHLIGYNAARGDLTPYDAAPTRPQVVASADGNNCLLFSGNGWRVEMLEVAPAAATTPLYLFRFNGGNIWITGCKATGPATAAGIYSNNTAGHVVGRCEVSGMTGGIAIQYRSSAVVRDCYVHDCTGMTAGIGYGSLGSTSAILNNVVANIAGASAIGIDAGPGTTVLNNTVHGCGSHGIQLSNQTFPAAVQGNLVTNSGGYGLRGTAAGLPACYQIDGNAYYSNASGARSNVDDAGTTNPVDGSAPYANARDVTLTASPYVNAATGDYRLNSTAGGGAACRGSGLPSSWPGLSIAAYPDMGAVQHQDAGGSYAAASDVRSGVNRGDGTLGTLVVPTAGQVEVGVAFDASSSLTGTYDGSDRWTDPGVANVLSTVSYKANSTTNNRTGTYVAPDATYYLSAGPGFGAGGATAGTATVPTADQVLSGVSFGAAGTALSGDVDLPAAGDVQSGVTFGPAGGTAGTFAAPAAGDVRDAIGYGADGTEFAGTLTLPAADQVESGVTYGAGGTEFTGTLTISGMTLTDLRAELDARNVTAARVLLLSRIPDAAPGGVGGLPVLNADSRVPASVLDWGGVDIDLSDAGTLAAGGTTGATLKAGVAFDADALAGRWISFDSGAGAGQWAILTGNTAADPPVVTWDRTLAVAVDGTTGYTIGDPAAASGGGDATLANQTTIIDRVTAIEARTDLIPAGGFPANFPALAIAAGTGLVSIDLAQTGLAPRDLSAVADASLTVGDALAAALCGAVGDKAVVGTSYTVKTPSTGTLIRAYTLDAPAATATSMT